MKQAMVSEMGGAAKDIIKNEGNVKGLWTLANSMGWYWCSCVNTAQDSGKTLKEEHPGREVSGNHTNPDIFP